MLGHPVSHDTGLNTVSGHLFPDIPYVSHFLSPTMSLLDCCMEGLDITFSNAHFQPEECREKKPKKQTNKKTNTQIMPHKYL